MSENRQLKTVLDGTGSGTFPSVSGELKTVPVPPSAVFLLEKKEYSLHELSYPHRILAYIYRYMYTIVSSQEKGEVITTSWLRRALSQPLLPNSEYLYITSSHYENNDLLIR